MTSKNINADTKNKKSGPTENIEENKKDIAVKTFVDAINKKYGRGTMNYLGNEDKVSWKCISTGSLKIDKLTGIGGIPLGRITEIYGSEGSGKTTLVLSTIAQAQKSGYRCAFIDVEHAINTEYACQLGVDKKSFLFCQPDSAEDCFGIMDDLIRSSAIDLIVVDSVAALVSQSEAKTNFGDTVMATQARFLSQSLRRLVSLVNEFNCGVVFINQIRHKVGVFFGSSETTTGGLALPFYAALRISIAKRALIRKIDKGQTTFIGQNIECKIVKSKFSAPHRSITTSIIYGEGFDQNDEIFDICVQAGIIQQKGTWYSYNTGQLGQGKESCVQAIRNNPELKNTLMQEIKNKEAEINSTPIANSMNSNSTAEKNSIEEGNEYEYDEPLVEEIEVN